MNLNKAELIGNLTADPTSRELPSGQKVASFQIATSYVWRDAKSKERQETTDFHHVLAWGRLADVVAKYLKKGDRVYIDGRLHNRTWSDKSGSKQVRMEIVIRNLIMLGGRKKHEDNVEKVEKEVMEAVESREG